MHGYGLSYRRESSPAIPSPLWFPPVLPRGPPSASTHPIAFIYHPQPKGVSMGVRVRQRPDKPGWWLFINHRGQQKKKHFTDKDTALKVARQVRERIALGEFSIESPNTQRFPFRTYYQHWLETYAKTALKPSTLAFYTTAYKVHLGPFLGDTDIREITRKQLKDFVYAKLSSGLSRNSVKGYLAPLSEMCQWPKICFCTARRSLTFGTTH